MKSHQMMGFSRLLHRKMLIVGLSGVTCGGKTTISQKVKDILRHDGIRVATVNQDDHFKELDELEKIDSIGHYNFEIPSAVNYDTLKLAIEKEKQKLISIPNSPAVLFIEGILIFADEEIRTRCNLKYFIRLNYDECFRRRQLRTDYEPPDIPGFFEVAVWPYYEQHLEFVQNNVSDVKMLDGEQEIGQITRSIVTEIQQKVFTNWIKIQAEKLDSQTLIDFVSSETCGAVSIFLGTTRDNFEGKTVVKLSYEAYDEMAVKKIDEICANSRVKWPEICRIAIHHRIGEVKVKEASVAIAVSSPHRKDAQEATQYIIDELKRMVPIWKKEIYANGEGAWKSNKECSWNRTE